MYGSIMLLFLTRHLLMFLSLDSKRFYLVSVADCGQHVWSIRTLWCYTNFVLLSSSL